ncbi:MAG TPA: type II toxin-antitoxin system VapC family toxin [Thermoanaerobaculia bacterium]|nr:type II toxin-antitoxin system VapC family toxin [Thermoanaerobaculia bacterium]
MATRPPAFALYLDTSALMKLFVQEDGSDRVRALAGGRLGAQVLLVSRLGYTEASVSLARLVHLGRLAAADLPRHLGSLDDYWDRSIQEVGITEAVLDEARQLAQRFPLRTYDAIHLASAREARRMLRGVFEGEVQFLTFDDALLKAAREVGFTVPGGG